MRRELAIRIVAALLGEHADAGQLQLADPRGIVRRTEYDRLGRVTRATDNYVSPGTPGSPAADSNRAVAYAYDLPGHALTRTALLPAGAQQATEYRFEARLATGSKLDSNELLTEVRYPDRTSGAPGTLAADRRSLTSSAGTCR